MVEGFVRYMLARGLAAETVRRRVVSLRRFDEWLGDRPVTAATHLDVEDWLATLRTPRTRAAYRSDLAVFYRWAWRRGLVAANPVDQTDPVRTPRPLPRPVPAATVALAIGVARPGPRRAIMLGAYAGLRVSEIATLHTDDLALAAPATLTVRGGKGGKDRAVPLYPLLAAELATLPAGYVFPADDLGPVTTGTVRRWIVATFASIGADVLPHQLRHGFATELARVTNGNLLLVAHVLGHESVTTTQGYTAWACGPEAAAVAMMWEAS